MNPYLRLDEKSFWSTAVAKKNMFDIDDLWDPKFAIIKTSNVATFGSCFAQHIGHAMQEQGFKWLITEPPPEQLSLSNAKKMNYGLFTARTGNIYTVSLLKQWVNWALSKSSVPDEVWQKDGRFFDPFRPNVEPGGFESAEEVFQSREITIEAFKNALEQSSVFVFTLGLTESWINLLGGYEYAICPGTVAGNFEKHHHFINQDYDFINKTLTEVIKEIRLINPTIRFIFTVSPVPLTATMSGNHVLIATIESKSILRSVACHLSKIFDFVDYFPSYEIINSPPFRGTFFESNQRNVNKIGVNHVMNQFFGALNKKFPEISKIGSSTTNNTDQVKEIKAFEDSICEEEILNAFAQPKGRS